MRRLRNYGSDRRYRHEIVGRNSRLDELQAAYLAVKLPGLNSANERRRSIAHRYDDGLQAACIPELALPGTGPSVWHQFVVQTPDRDRLQASLAQVGVGTTIHYPVAPFDQPCYAGQYDRTQYPVAAQLARTVLSLPMGDYLADAEVDRVIAAVTAAAAAPMAGSPPRTRSMIACSAAA